MVALKFLHRNIISNQERKKPFLHEAQAAASLNHQNICTIYGIEEVEDNIFIVMEYIEGETLQQFFNKKKLGIKEILNISLQITEGLKEAHSKELIHGDLKSSNIMMTPKGTVKIMDFGLARPVESSPITNPSTSRDSICYLSPEQIKKERIDKRSDIWAFGVILYQLVTQHMPFKGSKDASIMYSIISYDPTPIERYAKNVPPELKNIIEKSLSKDMAHRQKDANELLKELSHLKDKPFEELDSTSDDLKPRKTLIKIGLVAAALIMVGLLFLILEKKEGTRFKYGDMPKIAILAFDSMNNDKDITYFCWGIADEISKKLSRLKQLQVITRSSASVRLYNFPEKSPQKIGERLMVDYIVKGAVQRTGQKILIKSELFDTENSEQLWAGQYNIEDKDIFKAQANLTKEIAIALKARIPVDEIDLLEKQQKTENFNAYDTYLLGRYYWEKRASKDLLKALEYFQKAITIDPNFALAYTGIADVYNVLCDRDLISKNAGYPKSLEAVKMALSLDKSLAEAHAALGMTKFEYEYDIPEALKELRLAVKLDPSYAIAYSWYAYVLNFSNEDINIILDEGTKSLEKALEMDPFNFIQYTNLYEYRTRAYDWKKAEEIMALVKELDEHTPDYFNYYVQLLIFTGKTNKLASEVINLNNRIKSGENNLDLYRPLTSALFYLGRYDESIGLLRIKIIKDSASAESHYLLGFNFLMKKNYSEAIGEFDKCKEYDKQPYAPVDVLSAIAKNRLGNSSELTMLIQRLESPANKEKQPAVALAELYCEQGKDEIAFRYLNEAVSKHDMGTLTLKMNPLFLKYHNDPRFKEILKKMNLN
jgi:serine/threonine protein kinase/tetratricopeptide (TPR) repeat protein